MRRTWLGLLDPIDEEKSLDSSERILQGSQLNTWRKKKKKHLCQQPGKEVFKLHESW